MGRAWAVNLCLLLGVASCFANYTLRRSGPQLADIDERAPVLKLHQADGSVFIMTKWEVRRGASASIHGLGRWVGPERLPASQQVFDVPLSSVVLFETNSLECESSSFMRGLAGVQTVVYALGLAFVLAFTSGSNR